MKIISVLDTSIADSNIGNQIVMDSVNNILNNLFKEDFFYRIQFAEKFGRKSLGILRKSDHIFFGGTNSLSSQMNKYSQMGFSVLDSYFVNNITLLGVGWWQYQSRPNVYTRFLLKRLLSSEGYHSVRDGYTKSMLNAIGITNVLNTSCPTTWILSKEHCKAIPASKSREVVTTLTDYNKSPENDTKLINLLLNNYENVFCWIQGIGDKEYVNALDVSSRKRLFFIAPKLSAYDTFLTENNVDYIGTRLHAGIRALQKKKRTLILSVDNRAKEISEDIGLNVAPRGDFEKIVSFIQNEYITDITLPEESIGKWMNQYK